MRSAALALCLLPTIAIADDVPTVHPFELTTRGDALDGKLVSTHCIMVAATANSAICLAYNGFGEISPANEIDLNFSTLNNGPSAFAGALSYAQEHCGGQAADRACRVDLTGRVRDGREFPAIDVTTLSFRSL